jgi:hypothetical protein
MAFGDGVMKMGIWGITDPFNVGYRATRVCLHASLKGEDVSSVRDDDDECFKKSVVERPS